MAISKLNDIDGFILREMKYRESSKILEVYTKDLGKVSIMARGVLRKNSKNASLTRRFTKVNLNLYKGKGQMYGIKDGSLLETYSKSHKNYDIIVYKSVIADLLLRTIDHSQEDSTYKLLDKTFEAFESMDKDPLDIFLSFMIKYISFSGYKPNFRTCPFCGKARADMTYFSIREGSIICDEDKYLVKDRTYLSPDELRYFMKLLYTPSEDLGKIEKVKGNRKVGKLIIDLSLDKLDLGMFNSLSWVIKDLSERK